MKRLITLGAALAVAVILGGGCTSTDNLAEPDGPHSKDASEIRLIPNTLEAHTNGNVYLTAHVYDANGQPIKNEEVLFRKITGVGTLSDSTRKTDEWGLCQVTLGSNVEGFALVEASTQNSTGVFVRDAEFVYFERREGQAIDPEPGGGWGGGGRLAMGQKIQMEIDSDLDGIYNEPLDFLIRDAGNEAIVRARFLNNNDVPIPGAVIEFYSDLYSYQQLIFTEGSSAVTDQDGYAVVKVQVSIAVAEEKPTLTLVAYEAITGATERLDLEGTAIGAVTVFAQPSRALIVENVGASSTITAFLFDIQNQSVADGTVVRFVTTSGLLETSNGVLGTDVRTTTSNGRATVTWTGFAEGTATITASAGGQSGATGVSASASTQAFLEIVPGEKNVLPGSGTSFTIISNDPIGTGFFLIDTNEPDLVTIGPITEIGANMYSFTVMNTFDTADQVGVEITVQGATSQATATMNVGNIAYQLDPQDAHLNAGLSMWFTIYGGQPPYAIFANHCECINFGAGTTGFSPSPAGGSACGTSIGASGDSFSVSTSSDIQCVDESITISAVDLTGQVVTTTLILDEAADLVVTPDSWDLGLDLIRDLHFLVTGGQAPYAVEVSYPNFAQIPGCFGLDIVTPEVLSAGMLGTNWATFDIRVDTNAGPMCNLTGVEFELIVRDLNAQFVTVDMAISGTFIAPGCSCVPTTVTGLGPNPDANTADDIACVISGGTAPYSVTSSDPLVIAHPGALAANTWTSDPEVPVAPPANITFTITDATMQTGTCSVTVQ